jgi:AraC-like DNA-binding protein
MEYSTLTSWVRMIWEGLKVYGIDADTLFEEVGLDPRLLADPDARYPLSKMVKLWAHALDRTGDPCFGLTVAQQWHPTTWHALGYAWLASSTLEDALKRMVRYSSMITTSGVFVLEDRGTSIRLIVHPHSKEVPRPAAVADTFLGNVIHMCRMSFGDDFNPLRVYFCQSGEGCRKKRSEFFRSPIEYGSEDWAIDFDPDSIRRPLATANAALAHANERIIAEYLPRLELGTTTSKVKAMLVDHLPSGEATEEGLAESMNLSRSSLQRRLREEGTTYRAVLQEVRCELAGKMLLDGSKTLNEVSFLLGFADLSAFSRAFKRWTGLAPTAYVESRQ